MPKLGLEIGSRVLVNLTPMSAQKPAMLQGEFVGAVHYEFMIIRLPSVPGLANKILPRMHIEVSFQENGAAVRFTAEVLAHTGKPSFLLYTTYPDRMRVVETRQHHRALCAMPVIIASPHGDGRAVITDLSLGGCRLVMQMTGQSGMRQVAEGDRLVLQTCLSAEGEAVRGIGIVRMTETNGGKLHMGIAFDEGHKAFAEALKNYLAIVCSVA